MNDPGPPKVEFARRARACSGILRPKQYRRPLSTIQMFRMQISNTSLTRVLVFAVTSIGLIDGLQDLGLTRRSG